MSSSHARVASRDPARLLRTLCNHWRHKFEIRRDHDRHAHIPFGEHGEADFAVAGDALEIRVHQEDPARHERLQQIIERHLRTFERDETLAFDWQRG